MRILTKIQEDNFDKRSYPNVARAIADWFVKKGDYSLLNTLKLAFF